MKGENLNFKLMAMLGVQDVTTGPADYNYHDKNVPYEFRTELERETIVWGQGDTAEAAEKDAWRRAVNDLGPVRRVAAPCPHCLRPFTEAELETQKAIDTANGRNW